MMMVDELRGKICPLCNNLFDLHQWNRDKVYNVSEDGESYAVSYNTVCPFDIDAVKINVR